MPGLDNETLCHHLLLIKNGTVYAPWNLGEKDILVTGDQIGLIGDDLNFSDSIAGEIIDATGKFLVPGFIDSHVHIAGGGGEGGFKTRTPEIVLSDIVRAGVTTVVGLLGTDGTTRTMTNLLAKARALEEEGITSFIYTGSYQMPVRTLTGSIIDDIVLIDKIIGVGEIAISDHRSSHPTATQLAQLLAEARVGGLLSGKAGVVNFHMGDGDQMLAPLEEALRISDIPPTQFIVTHVNRNERLFQKAIEFAKQSGLIDLTTYREEDDHHGTSGSCSELLKKALLDGVKIENISFSSDAQGSLPVFDNNGNFSGLEVARIDSLLRELKASIKETGLPPEVVLQTVTSNPARNLKLSKKGQIRCGNDADIVIFSEQWEIDSVLAKGKWLMRNGEILRYGTFESRNE